MLSAISAGWLNSRRMIRIARVPASYLIEVLRRDLLFGFSFAAFALRQVLDLFALDFLLCHRNLLLQQSTALIRLAAAPFNIGGHTVEQGFRRDRVVSALSAGLSVAWDAVPPAFLFLIVAIRARRCEAIRNKYSDWPRRLRCHIAVSINVLSSDVPSAGKHLVQHRAGFGRSEPEPDWLSRSGRQNSSRESR
jgi:hypothetical protein